eukprot:GHVL01011038.1.p2 GENE.GHVL01011038.1~~GHVL01011038.1.p2  ORF type:complete len:291 (-),score=26.43 GHVL01011038.1:321-1193(-)
MSQLELERHCPFDAIENETSTIQQKSKQISIVDVGDHTTEPCTTTTKHESIYWRNHLCNRSTRSRSCSTGNTRKIRSQRGICNTSLSCKCDRNHSAKNTSIAYSKNSHETDSLPPPKQKRIPYEPATIDDYKYMLRSQQCSMNIRGLGPDIDSAELHKKRLSQAKVRDISEKIRATNMSRPRRVSSPPLLTDFDSNNTTKQITVKTGSTTKQNTSLSGCKSSTNSRERVLQFLKTVPKPNINPSPKISILNPKDMERQPNITNDLESLLHKHEQQKVMVRGIKHEFLGGP